MPTPLVNAAKDAGTPLYSDVLSDPRYDPMPSHAFRALQLLDVRGLTVRGVHDGSRSLDSVSLLLGHGETLGLVGELGSGIVALTRVLSGHLNPEYAVDSGSILFDGRELIGRPPAAPNDSSGTRIAYLPPNLQTYLDDTRTIGKQLEEALRKELGLSQPAARARAVEALAEAGVRAPEPVSRLYPGDLSPGIIQRIAVASALAHDAALLVAVIPARRSAAPDLADLLRLLRDLRQRRGFALLLASDDFAVVAAGCERVAIMHAGRITEQGSAADLLSSPQHPHTRRALRALEYGAVRRNTREAQDDEGD